VWNVAKGVQPVSDPDPLVNKIALLKVQAESEPDGRWFDAMDELEDMASARLATLQAERLAIKDALSPWSDGHDDLVAAINELRAIMHALRAVVVRPDARPGADVTTPKLACPKCGDYASKVTRSLPAYAGFERRPAGA
jgi:hypothetical protein